MTTAITWPTAFVPALRALWLRTLFPAKSPVGEQPRFGTLLILIALPALMLYPCLGFRLLEPDEGRYAEIPREMLVRGDWVVPHLQSEPYLDKPPLMYWLVAISFKLFGVNAAAARFVPALAVHSCIMLCYVFGCRFLGERRAARGAVLLALMPGLVGIGRILTLDGLLTLWVLLGQLSGFAYLRERTRWLGFICAIACALGVLTKGPIAVVLVVAPLLLWHWLHGKTAKPTPREWTVFGVTILAINLPWYVLISLRQPEFLKYFFWQHNLQRFLTPFDHLQPIWYYGPILLVGLLPCTLWLWPATKALFGSDAARRSPELAFFLLCGGFCVGFFSLSGCKLPTYILPAFPPLALAMGVLLDDGERLFRKSRAIVLGAFAMAIIAAQSFLLPAYAHHRSPLREEATVKSLCADPNVAIECFPRNCDSVGFYLGRADLKSTRSKHVHLLIAELLSRPRTIVLLTHRHSLEALKFALPPDLKMTPLASFHDSNSWLAPLAGATPWGLCDIAVVEKVR